LLLTFLLVFVAAKPHEMQATYTKNTATLNRPLRARSRHIPTLQAAASSAVYRKDSARNPDEMRITLL